MSPRTVVITGCSSGLGLNAAIAFAKGGDRVFATVRNLAGAPGLRAAARKAGVSVDIEPLDVTNPKSFDPFVCSVLGRTGRLDVLVNNAGVLPVGAFEDQSEADLRRVMETNFFGPALLTKAVLPVMRGQLGGYVIMVSSLSGIAGKAGDAAYTASKFALEGLTEAMRHEVARWNIRTALVEPAQYATNMFRVTAGGSLGACAPDSPYAPLIRAQQAQLRKVLGQGRDAALIGDLLVKISRSDGTQFRWAADEVAERVRSLMWAQSDSERDGFLRQVGDVDWWVEGADAPPTAS
jgi:NAD(P)-dependent dehydrogenase (short-subunit alcohol dehydrogenase family)